MPIKAGHCSGCGVLLWRVATAQKDWGDTKAGEVFLLWPMPESVYAIYKRGPDNVTPGVAYCHPCAPPVGSPGIFGDDSPVTGYETAQSRYQNWYHPERRKFYETWLADHLFLEPGTITELLAYWDEDRAEPLVVP